MGRVVECGALAKMTEKLQKVLARAGIASRREIERWIEQGRIRVNGELAKLGDRVDALAKIQVDGRYLTKLNRQQETIKRRILMYHKPVGEMCTRSDPEGRPTVFDHLPRLLNQRWIMIGRLDFNTSGLLLFTNDGDLANRLMHPSSGIEREYAVRVLGDVTKAMLTKLRTGVELDDGRAAFEKIEDAGGEGANHWYHVTLKEGRNRIVRRLWETQGVTVSRLIRVRFANISLPRWLRIGKWEEMGLQEANDLARLVEL